MMITSANVISELERRFPSFIVDDEMKDLLTIIGADLKEYIVENIENVAIVSEAVIFVNELVDTFDYDESCGAFADEIALGMYTKFNGSFEIFINRLSDNARRYFELNVKLWTGQK